MDKRRSVKVWMLLSGLACQGIWGGGGSNALQELVDAGVATGAEVIRIPPGRYEVAPRGGVHLELEGLRDLTIEAKGVEMVCTETTLAIRVKACENLRIVGLAIDYDPLPFTQGRIVEISADRKSHIIEIMEGFPEASSAYRFKHSIYTAEGELRFGSYYQYELEVLGEGRLKVSGLSPRVDGGEEVGDIVVVSTRHLSGRYQPHAIVVEESLGTVLEEVTLYSSPCFGFFESGSSGSVYLNCVVDRRAGRVHSLNADAFHSKHAEVGPQIIGCKAMWQGDDCINICGDYYLVTGGEGDWVRILGARELRIHEGDTLQLVTVEGERLENALVVAIHPSGERIGPDEAVVGQSRLERRTIERMNLAYRIRLDRPVSLPPGSVVGSENRMGNGFAVKNGLFGNNRSRGILIKASRGEITDNTLINTHMQAIKIAPEYYWLESGFSRDLTVARNRILRPRREAIQILGIGPFAGHHNIHLVDNFILTPFSPALRVEAVDTGRIAANQVLRTDGTPLPDAVQIRFSKDLKRD